MEQIEVGEYVRDCDGFIVKVKEIQEYKEDDDFWYQEKTLKGTWKSMVVKHSKNIIDLIEVGDYVNGRKVKHIRDYEDFKRLDFDDDMDDTIYAEQIYSIVTKEQFTSMEYKV